MKATVTVVFSADQRFQIETETGLSSEAGFEWLDEQFEVLEAEPLRASGKVLLADKVLAVAAAAGPRRFANPDFAQAYASYSVAALGRPIITVDVPELSVSF
jgi:hypothetical protein